MTLRKVYETVRKAIIYEIKCNITGEIYIGSTISSLAERMAKHKNNNNNTTESKQIINRGDYTENELESFYTRFELARLLKEQYWMDNIENINKRRAFINHKKSVIQSNNFHNKVNNSLRPKQSIKCPCGGKYKYASKVRHFRTIKHRQYIDTQ